MGRFGQFGNPACQRRGHLDRDKMSEGGKAREMEKGMKRVVHVERNKN